MDSALNQGFDNETKLVMVNQRFGDEERDLRHLWRSIEWIVDGAKNWFERICLWRWNRWERENYFLKDKMVETEQIVF